MKIAYFSPHWPLGASTPNGIVTVLHHTVPALRAMGHEVYIITLNGPKDHNDPYLIVGTTAKTGPLQSLLSAIKFKLSPSTAFYNMMLDQVTDLFAKLHQRVGLDVIEMEESFGITKDMSDRLPVPIVLRLHGPYFNVEREGETAAERKRAEYRIVQEGKAIRNATALSCPSKYTLDHAIDHYGGTNAKFAETIPNPIPAPDDAQVWQSEQADKNHILFVGRIDRAKGADIAIKAFAKLAETYPDLTMTIAGPDNGVVSPNGRRRYFQDHLDEYVPAAFHDRLNFLGPVAFNDLVILRQQASVTIIPSRWENFPSTVGEAMGYGCPIVASRSFGIKEMIAHGKSGLLVKPRDVDALSTGIEQILNDPLGAAKMAAQARKDCIARYAAPAVAAQTVEFFERVINAG